MTCLIATAAGIWADRRVTGGATVFRSSRKVVRGVGLVAAFTGANSACTKAARAVRAGEGDPHKLADMCDGLIVTPTSLWELWDKLATRIPRNVRFLAHGAGFAEAQAFLTGAGRFDDRTIRRALSYVGKVRTDCGGGVDFLPLKEKL